MAQVKEPYGLVYNTDGTLCTTYRDDVVPFPGVTSFAVETATTNLLKDVANFTTGSWGRSNVDVTSLEYNGMPGARFTPTGAGTAQVFQIFLSSDAAGRAFTWSFYARGRTARTFHVNFYGGVSGTFQSYVIQLTTEWRRYSITHTFPATATSGRIQWGNVTPYWGTAYLDWIEVAGVQVEEKPFATSFVDGSRPSGRILFEDLGFNPATDDWVISYWKYPVATHDDTQNDYNLMSLGKWFSGLDKGFIIWGKYVDVNKFIINCALNNKTQTSTFSPIFDSSWYFYNWHYEVIKKQGKVLNYYVDGVKQCELTIPADLELQTPFNIGFTVGGYYGSNPCNSLIAALYYGYNSATWTDDYIREVYEAKIPFPAQNKLSIY